MRLDALSLNRLALLVALFLFAPNLTSANDSIKLITNSPIQNNGPSEKCNVEICTSLLKMINNANETIDFAIYGLRGQNEILKALINAEKRGVIVRGVIDKTLKGKSYYTDTHLLSKNLKNIKDDQKIDLERAEHLEGRIYNENQQCERPDNTKGPLQCFEGKGYASKEHLLQLELLGPCPIHRHSFSPLKEKLTS